MKVRFCDISKSFGNLYPKLLLDWDYSNNDIDPYKIYPGTIRRVYWRCNKCETSWKTSVNNRALKESSCPSCAAKERGISQRYSIDEIKKLALSIGNWEILSNLYTKAKVKLRCRCLSCNKVHYMSWDKIRQGQKCYFCYIESISGQNHPKWCGGNKKGYCLEWNSSVLKDYIKYRDNFICQNPYCYRNTNKLNVHHIDYNKKNCKVVNLITICHSCNARANFDRKWHTEWYNTIIKNKYKDKYNDINTYT